MKKSTLGLLTICATVLLNTTSSIASDKLSDTWKEATIETRLNLNDILERYDIETEVVSGSATLKGQVASDIEKQLAGEIASNVEGVNNINNLIVVDENVTPNLKDSLSQSLADSTTTAKVKSRLLWSSAVPGLNINVDTSGGVVTLKGDVPDETQKALAEKLASNISGVKRVKNEIRATNPKTSKIGSVDLKKLEKNTGGALESAGDTLTDTWIDAKVTASLSFASSLTVENLSVDAKSGVVTISGTAYNEADKQLAAEIVKDVKGVKTVINEIKVI